MGKCFAYFALKSDCSFRICPISDGRYGMIGLPMGNKHARFGLIWLFIRGEIAAQRQSEHLSNFGGGV
jgi:hypothetical protein